MSANPRLTARPSAGDHDLPKMRELATAAQDYVLHTADRPWRQSSPSARMPERTQIWEDAGGRLVAWAMLQFPRHCFDYQVHPGARSPEFQSAVLAWACARL